MAVFSGNGSNTSPSFTFSSDTNSGMYRADADKLGFATAGTGHVFLNSSGNLGVGGNSNPGYDLDVVGQLGCTHSGSIRHLVNIDSDGGKSYWYDGSATNTAFIAGDTGNAQFDGVVMVGTSSPNRQIDVVSSSGSNVAITSTGSGNNQILIGNQNGSGANNPFVIRGTNGMLYMGTGGSWSTADGGTFTQKLWVDDSPNLVVGGARPGSLGIINALIPGGSDGALRRYYYYGGGGNRTLVIAGVAYFFRIRVVGWGNFSPNISEVQFIAGSRGSGLGHSHQVTQIGAATNASISVATADSGNERTYTLTIAHTEGLNKNFNIEVEVYGNTAFSLS